MISNKKLSKALSHLTRKIQIASGLPVLVDERHNDKLYRCDSDEYQNFMKQRNIGIHYCLQKVIQIFDTILFIPIKGSERCSCGLLFCG